MAVARDNGGWDADAVRALRLRLSLSQEDFAAQVPVTVSTINRWENGHARPGRLAGMKLDELSKQQVGNGQVG